MRHPLLNVITECYVDTNLVRTLLNAGKVNHQHACSKVCRTMDRRFNDTFAVGIIDDDKRKPYDKAYTTLAHASHLTLMKRPATPHYLIIISKAAEDFILSCAAERGIDMQDYDLPRDMESLKKVTKNVTSDDDNRLKRLFKALEKATEMSRLKTILEYLADKEYECDDDKLKSLFRDTPAQTAG